MSQGDSQIQTIDGVNYEVFMLAPSIAMDLLVDLGKILGPAFAVVVDGHDEQSLDNEIDFSKAAGVLFQNLEKLVLRDTMKTLASVTRADGKPLDKIWEIHFRGKLGSLIKWLGFALKVQYADFFDAMGTVTGIGTAAKPRA